MAAPWDNMRGFKNVKWGDLHYEERDAPKIRKLLSEKTELQRRIESLDGKLRALGESERFLMDRHASPRRASSGQSNTMSKMERKAHYVRKGILEAEKERIRKERYPGDNAREGRRKTYKQAVRNIRRTVKAGHRKGEGATNHTA
jgi:hypothetical protein